MATVTKTALENALREKNVETLVALLTEGGEEVLRVGGNVIAFPTTDGAGNDAWIEITVKVPKGERLGKGEGFAGYDGYGLAEFYAEQTAIKKADAEKRKADAAAKRAKLEARKSKVQVKPTTDEPATEGEDA